MRALKRTSAQLVADARARIKEVSAEELMADLASADLAVVDIRDIRERERSGFIPGSFHAPRGMIEFWVDPASLYYKQFFCQDARFLFYCASGWRSSLTVAALQDMGFEASHLAHGFTDWQKKGGPVERT